MKLKIKKILAKEVIIFFSSVVLIFLTVAVIWTVDYLKYKSKYKYVSSEVSILTHKSDSIKSTFPKVLSFDEIITCNLPENIYDKEIKVNSTDHITTKNIKLLYNLLISYGYKVKIDKNVSLPPIYSLFSKELKKEFRLGFNEKDRLKNIFDFLCIKNCIDISFSQFVFNLEGFPEPLDPSSRNKYQEINKQIENSKNQLRTIKNNRFSEKEVFELSYAVSLIVFIIIYPIRLMVLILFWAFKTIKTK